MTEIQDEKGVVLMDSNINNSPTLAFAKELGYPPKMAFRISELAEISGVTVNTLYNEVQAGRLRAMVPEGRKRGMRVTYKDFDEWIEGGFGD